MLQNRLDKSCGLTREDMGEQQIGSCKHGSIWSRYVFNPDSLCNPCWTAKHLESSRIYILTSHNTTNLQHRGSQHV